MVRATLTFIEGLRGPAPRGYKGDRRVFVHVAFVQAAWTTTHLRHAAMDIRGVTNCCGTPSANGCSSPIRHRGYVTYR